MIENVSTKFGEPLPGVEDNIPLNPVQDNYPHVQHWEPEAWNLMQKGVSERVESNFGIFGAFMENRFGQPIPESERRELRRDFYSFFTEIFNGGGIPVSHTDTNFTTREQRRIAVEGKFTWLRLCNGHWKFRQTWTHALTKWRANKLPNLLEIRKRANRIALEGRKVIELTSLEDDMDRPRPRPTSDSSSGSKRGQDNEPATEPLKKHKAMGPATSFHPAKPKAKGKQTMRFAQVSVPQLPHPITILTRGLRTIHCICLIL